MTSPALTEHSGGGLTTRRSIGRRRRRCRDSGRGGRRNYGRVRLIAGHRRRGRRRARSLRGFFLFAGHAFSSKQSARHETRTFENEHAGTAMHERSHRGARGKEGSDHSARRDQLAQCRVGMSACGNSTSVAHVRRRNHRGWSRPRQRTALGIVGGLARCAGISPKTDTLLVLHHFLAFALRPGVRRTVDGLCVVAARRVHLANVAGKLRERGASEQVVRQHARVEVAEQRLAGGSRASGRRERSSRDDDGRRAGASSTRGGAWFFVRRSTALRSREGSQIRPAAL